MLQAKDTCCVYFILKKKNKTPWVYLDERCKEKLGRKGGRSLMRKGLDVAL